MSDYLRPALKDERLFPMPDRYEHKRCRYSRWLWSGPSVLACMDCGRIKPGERMPKWATPKVKPRGGEKASA